MKRLLSFILTFLFGLSPVLAKANSDKVPQFPPHIVSLYETVKPAYEQLRKNGFLKIEIAITEQGVVGTKLSGNRSSTINCEIEPFRLGMMDTDERAADVYCKASRYAASLNDAEMAEWMDHLLGKTMSKKNTSTFLSVSNVVVSTCLFQTVICLLVGLGMRVLNGTYLSRLRREQSQLKWRHAELMKELHG